MILIFVLKVYLEVFLSFRKTLYLRLEKLFINFIYFISFFQANYQSSGLLNKKL
jgi:hypothetical protein